MATSPTVVWLRDDLRVADNPALHSARARGQVVCVFLQATAQWRAHHVGQRRLDFLEASLQALARDLATLNIPLLRLPAPHFRDAPEQLMLILRALGSKRLTFNSQLPVNEHVRDAQVEAACSVDRVDVERHHGGTLVPPGEVVTAAGAPYTVFTAFKRKWLATIDLDGLTPLPAPTAQPPATLPPALRQHLLKPSLARSAGSANSAAAGERSAHERLQIFVERRLVGYHRDRDFPALDATSGLSAHLSVGSLSARQCAHAALRARGDPDLADGANAWLNELIWRDFYRHVVALFPHVSKGQAFRRGTDAIPWRSAPDELAAWQAGATGYPLVDAAMRQLNATGWMHNRLRMVSAMFLSKHLLIDWRLGERYFMEQLTDGDFAANNGGWQWSASTGTDAVPYFRIFNPTTQGRRFDANADFVRRQVPELSELSAAQIYQQPHELVSAYPAPIVDHRFARQRALATFKALPTTR